MDKLDANMGLAGLPDGELRKRVANDNWRTDPSYVRDEEVFKMLRDARASQNEQQIGILSSALSRRILARARGFAMKSGLFPTFFGDLQTASEELAQVFWEHLLTSESDAARAEQAFGQVFKLRAIDFQRTFYAKKRKNQSSLDEADDDDEAGGAKHTGHALHDDERPDDTLTKKQEFQRLRTAMLGVLTTDEFATLEMLYDLEMPVKDVAKALGRTPRSVNNYETRALAKLQKELSK